MEQDSHQYMYHDPNISTQYAYEDATAGGYAAEHYMSMNATEFVPQTHMDHANAEVFCFYQSFSLKLLVDFAILHMYSKYENDSS